MLTISDSVSHLKTSIIGNSITLPIRDGKLVLGTWQGIYLAEVSRERTGSGDLSGEEDSRAPTGASEASKGRTDTQY